MSDTQVQDAVKEKYGEIARSVGTTRCCSPSACGCGDPITSDLYSDGETAGLPAEAVAASLGCGNPTALVDLRPGQTVLDLGSGGGIDVLLSAKRVGPTGKVYGLDMTDDMLTLARENQRRAGATNVEFLKGTIEAIPLPDQSVDVIISNCVINLSTDKPSVFSKMHRILRPGGRIGISDVVADNDLTSTERAERGSYVGCIAGALSFAEFEEGLQAAGFADISITSMDEPVPGIHSAIIRATNGSSETAAEDPVAPIRTLPMIQGSCC
jgi:arsenite methyltransferase